MKAGIRVVLNQAHTVGTGGGGGRMPELILREPTAQQWEVVEKNTQEMMRWIAQTPLHDVDVALPLLYGSRCRTDADSSYFWPLEVTAEMYLGDRRGIRSATLSGFDMGMWSEALARLQRTATQREVNLLPITLMSLSKDRVSNTWEASNWTNTVGYIPLIGAEVPDMARCVFQAGSTGPAFGTAGEMSAEGISHILEHGEAGRPYVVYLSPLDNRQLNGYILTFYPIVKSLTPGHSLMSLMDRGDPLQNIYNG